MKQELGEEGLSRRDFLKSTGAIIGGAVLTSSVSALSCNTKNNSRTNSEPFYTVNNPGGITTVAMDCLYSIEHIWVKKLGDNVVKIGVTDKLQQLVHEIAKCELIPLGTIINLGESFGILETGSGKYSGKINITLLSPVSGEVLEMNQDLLDSTMVQRICMDPYGLGWMLKVKLSKAAELDELFAPMYYAYLQTQDWTGPVPEMH